MPIAPDNTTPPTANADRTPASVTCLNCGKPAGPEFCGHCGQKVDDGHGSLPHMVGELFSGWFSLDGRLLRTLRKLVRPGELTVSYLAGRRVVVLAPFRLYLLASLLLFSSALVLQTPDASRLNVTILGERVIEVPPSVIDGRSTSSVLEFLGEDSWLSGLLAPHLQEELDDLRQQPPQEIMDALFAGLRRLLPVSLILFVPFLAFALKILYLRSRTLYVDHLVFAVHLQSALFLALATGWALSRLADAGLFTTALIYAGIALLFLTIYLPLALHRVYRQRKRWTALKTLLLLYCYMQLLGIMISLPAVYVLVLG